MATCHPESVSSFLVRSDALRFDPQSRSSASYGQEKAVDDCFIFSDLFTIMYTRKKNVQRCSLAKIAR